MRCWFRPQPLRLGSWLSCRKASWKSTASFGTIVCPADDGAGPQRELVTVRCRSNGTITLEYVLQRGCASIHSFTYLKC